MYQRNAAQPARSRHAISEMQSPTTRHDNKTRNICGTACKRTVFLLIDRVSDPPTRGYEIHAVALANHLDRYARTRLFLWPKRLTPSTERSAARTGIPVTIAPLPYVLRKALFVFYAMRLVLANAHQGSVLWIRDYDLASLAVLFGWCRRTLRSKNVVTLFDASSLLFLQFQSGPLQPRRCVQLWIERQILRRVDLVRTLSHTMCESLVREGIPRTKILVHPVGASHKQTTWREPELPVRFLYVGSSDPWQGLPTLLNAMTIAQQCIPSIELSVVGCESTDCATSSVDLPTGKIHFHGRVDHSKLQAFYLSHHAFVVPRPMTPLTDLVAAMKIPEAMSYGIPIIASDLAVSREVLGNAAVFFRPGSARSLADQIAHVASSPNVRRELSQRALRAFRDYEWDNIANRIHQDLTCRAPL